MNPGTDRPDCAVRVADLGRGKHRTVALAPDAAARAEIAATLGLTAVTKLTLDGRIAPSGGRDWRFEGRLGATVEQPCVVTLAPVVTRLDEPVARRYVADWQPPAGDEVEVPDDVDSEPLGAEIDLCALMVEALSLAVPAWPRAEGADLGAAVFAEPGTEAMTDEAARPFAGLAALRDRLATPGDAGDDGGDGPAPRGPGGERRDSDDDT